MNLNPERRTDTSQDQSASEPPADIALDVHHSRLVVTEPTQQENEDGQGRP